MKISSDQALARVRAGLGRDPRDPLEAAVALESNGGIVGARALELGRDAVRTARAEAAATVEVTREPKRSPWSAPAAVGLLLVSLVWADMMMSGPGRRDAAGVLVGLPIGLALVGYLDRRFVAGDDGPRRTRANVFEVLLTIAVPCVGVGLLHPGGVVAVGVILILVCTTFAARFGVAVSVIATILIGHLLFDLGVRASAAAAASLLVATAVVTYEVLRVPPLPLPPTRVRFAAPRGLSGLGLGLLITPVIDLTTQLTSTRPLVVILPATIGGALGASALERMWVNVGRALDRAPTLRRPDRTVGRVYVRHAIEGFVIAMATSFVLSLLVLLVVPEVAGGPGTGALMAMAAVAAAGYTSTVLQGAGGETPSMVGLLAAGTVASVGTLLTDQPTAWVVGAVIVLHALWLPTVLQLFRDPERTLATRL